MYVVVGLTVLVAWMTLAPASFGGGSRYGAVSGMSMEPNLSAGDMIVVRPGTYRVGDIVAYRAGDRLVVHRVVGVADGRLVLRGDGNAAADADQPTPDQVLGELRLRVPHAGLAFAVLHDHFTVLAVAGLLVIALLWCASASGRVRSARSTSTAG